MRIGFVLTNLAGGGAEKSVLNLAAALAAQRHRVDIVLLERIVTHALPGGLAIHALTEKGSAIRKGWLGRRLAAWKLARLIARLGSGGPFDLIVSTLPFADEVAILADMPRHWCRIANTLSAEVARLAAQNRAKAARRMARYRRMYDGRALIAVSQGVAEDLRNGMELTRSRIEVIPNPFDFAALRALAAESAELPPRPYVIHVGRFSGQKRHDVLLDAFAKLRTPQRLVLLAAPERALSAMIEARGLAARVLVAGFRQNPYPWMAAAELLVLSSDHEGLPNVLIEALALGVPVVSTDCPSGPREILGAVLPDCLVPVGDADKLAITIARVLARRPDVSRVDLSRYAMARVVASYERLAAERN